MARRRRPPRAGALAELQPLRIATQIATLQALYYLTAGIMMLLAALVSGMGFGADMVLGWSKVRGDTTQGWMLSLLWLMDGGFFMALAIVYLVEKSKLVPDFALTMHGLHLVFTTLYTRALPTHSMWWMTMAGSAAVSVALGMWACRHRELQTVFFGGGRILGSGSGSAPGDSDAAEEGRAGVLEAEGGGVVMMAVLAMLAFRASEDGGGVRGMATGSMSLRRGGRPEHLILDALFSVHVFVFSAFACVPSVRTCYAMLAHG